MGEDGHAIAGKIAVVIAIVSITLLIVVNTAQTLLSYLNNTIASE